MSQAALCRPRLREAFFHLLRNAWGVGGVSGTVARGRQKLYRRQRWASCAHLAEKSYSCEAGTKPAMSPLKRRQITLQLFDGVSQPSPPPPIPHTLEILEELTPLREGARPVTCSSHSPSNSAGPVGGSGRADLCVGAAAPCLSVFVPSGYKTG